MFQLGSNCAWWTHYFIFGVALYSFPRWLIKLMRQCPNLASKHDHLNFSQSLPEVLHGDCSKPVRSSTPRLLGLRYQDKADLVCTFACHHDSTLQLPTGDLIRLWKTTTAFQLGLFPTKVVFWTRLNVQHLWKCLCLQPKALKRQENCHLTAVHFRKH